MPQVEEQTPALVETAESDPIVIRMQPSVRMTDDEFFEFCQINDDLMIERTAEGDLVIMPPVGYSSSRRNEEISFQLHGWTALNGTGASSDPSGGYRLPNGAVRAPDAAWFLKIRLKDLSPADQERFLPFCPDFVLELRSRTDRLSLARKKMQEYMENGARLGWLIDPFAHRVHVYRPGQPVEELENPESVSGDPVLPGFVLALTKVW